jgi:serine/threonine-protein kinase HipA
MTRAPAVRVEVHVDLPAGTTRAGTAFITFTRGELTTAFDYDPIFLGRSDAFDVSPDLKRSSGSAVIAGLPGAMADSAPDRWGRNLIKKRLQALNRNEGRVGQTVTDVDYLLRVSDFTRQGALRYRLEEGTFPGVEKDVPKPLELPRLLNAADIVSREASAKDEMAAIKLLLDAGTGSLGGARPKASVRDGDRLLIAKFPHHSDEWDVMAWEMTALDLAEACGIRTPHRQLVDVTGKHVLLLERFDRDAGARVPFISAMTLMQAHDGDHRDYVEVAEALQDLGGAVKRDLHELWRRIAFSIAINNTDDHLRNHGFLFQESGWCLSPMFDVNPNPDLGTERSTSINFVTDHEQALGALREVAEYFGVDADSAHEVWEEIIVGVADWREVAVSHGIEDRELRRFSDVFGEVAHT